MSANADYLAARVDADFTALSHLTYFRPSLVAVGAVGREVAADATAAAASAAAAASSYALQVTLGAGAYGIGTEPLYLVRAGSLGSMAFMDGQEALGVFATAITASTQVTPHDRGRLFIVTSGTVTLTMPLGADVPPGFFIRYKNRSGNNLTLARSGSDTFNAAAASVTIATGSGIEMCVRTAATTYEAG